MKRFCAFFVFILLYGTGCAAAPEDETMHRAIQLADTAWRTPVKDDAWVDLQTGKPTPPPDIDAMYTPLPEKSKNGFLVFSFAANAYYNSGQELAVNTVTGDVWDMFTCGHLSNPALRQMQDSLRLSLSDEQKEHYEQLHHTRPWDVGIAAPCNMEKLDADSAMKLADIAKKTSLYSKAIFGVPPDGSRNMFLIYPIVGSRVGILTYFAVNPWTGDVWNADECRLLSNSELREEQEHIREDFKGEALSEYERLHQLTPYRMVDDQPCEMPDEG